MNLFLTIAISGVLLSAAELCSAQTDTITYIRGLPESGEVIDERDSVDHPPINKRTNISPEQLPSAVVKLLDHEKLYSGWRTGVLEYDQNTGFYHVAIRESKVIRKYMFDKKGNVVSLDERNVPPEK
jgi:hypothetical protein